MATSMGEREDAPRPQQGNASYEKAELGDTRFTAQEKGRFPLLMLGGLLLALVVIVVAWLVIDERARVIVDAVSALADLVSATDSLERARGATLLANALLELARSVLTDPASWPPACPALTHRPPCLHHPPHGGEQIYDCQRRLKTDPFSSAKVDPLGLCA